MLAFDLDAETMTLARMCGAIDAPLTEETLPRCDLILIAICPGAAVRWVKDHAKSIAASAIVVDLCGVKRVVVEALAPLAEAHGFAYIGGHPMAGSERIGFANSKASLLENAYYILTPTPHVPAQKVEDCRQLVAKTGAIPLILDYRRHDYVTGAISHLPHVIAAALVNLIQGQDSEDGIMKMVAAGGFKDITRIASSSALMWQQICLSNTANISALLSDYIEALKTFQRQLDAKEGPALYNQFEKARLYRDSFIGASSGPIKRSHSISVDIDDKSGALARIAALLAEHGLSIKNIGITHNRESDDGVLKVEFYDEASMQKARDILAQSGYHADIRI